MEPNQQFTIAQNPDIDISTQTAPSSQTPLASPRDHVYRSLQSYPFHSDPSYQSGLSTILGHPTTPATHSELSDNPDLILQAQCFYFARKHGLDPIDITEYKNFLAITSPLQHQSHPQVTQNSEKIPPLERPDPVPRPSAPTPNTALTGSTAQSEPQNILLPRSPPPDPQTATNLTTAADPSDPTPPYPTSFADIVDLITQNKPIPGIEKIPETVLEPGSSKQDHTAKRKKPWEKSTTPDTQTALVGEDASKTMGDIGNNGETGIETPKQTGEGVVRILQPGAIADSGLLAKE